MNYSNQGHNPRIKKLSAAMRRGYAIAKRLGIRRGKGEVAVVDAMGNLTKVCALGYAVIGKFGVEEAKRRAGNADLKFNDFPNLNVANYKLMANSPNSLKLLFNEYTPTGFVIEANDRVSYPIKMIAKILEKSGY
jgi:hypothetical protein